MENYALMSDKWLKSWLSSKQGDTAEGRDVNLMTDAEREELHRYDRLWEAANPPASQLEVDTEAAWAKVEDRLFGEDKTIVGGGAKIRPLGRRMYRVAAAIAVVALAGWFIVRSQGGNEPLNLATGEGEKLEYLLADGTTVHLNENSELTFIAGRNSRELSLTGEAFFDVARDEERPFSITTGEVTTTVLGTSFNVRAYPNEPVEVAVTSGRVEVADADEEVVITEEQVVTYEPVTKVLSAPKEDVVQAEAWVREELVVKGKRLEDVIPALERFFGREIEFGNPALRNCIVEESTFYADDWAGAMANLAFRYGAKEQGGRIVLTGDEC